MLCVLLTTAGAGTKSVKVNVKKPGTLSKLIKQKRKYDITGIAIRGKINNDDIRFLRDICGKDDLKNTEGQVRYVDLTGVTFDPSGGPFLWARENYRVKGANSLPECMFYNCPIEDIVLPESLDSIGDWALAGTALRRLSLPENAYIVDNLLTGDSLLAELTLPNIHRIFNVNRLLRDTKALRKLTFRDIDYIPGSTFLEWAELEELVFGGLVGHIDGFCVTGNPRLRSISFLGTLVSTGGAQFVRDCPELGSVTFGGTVFCCGYGQPINCPKLKGYRVDGCVVNSNYPDYIPVTSPDNYNADSLGKALEDAYAWIDRQYHKESVVDYIGDMRVPKLVDVARGIGRTAIADTLLAWREVWSLNGGKVGDSYLETLQLSAPYERVGQKTPVIRYMPPTDSLLCRTREYFNLDSIAGQGDDISRMKNLLYWLHDHVRHDGGSSWPQCRFNAVDLYEVCQRENRGLNCRFLAIMLNEMLLAEGIPARYLTCQSQQWNRDNDCHVINVAWSTSLGKWVWMDASFAAYVTDENGLLLHPGEVRERLRDGRPLVLNEDANWNHQEKQTVDHYLKTYMAKNLYVISANTLNQSEPEGVCDHEQGSGISLIPKGFRFKGNNTTDDEYFWQGPTATE